MGANHDWLAVVIGGLVVLSGITGAAAASTAAQTAHQTQDVSTALVQSAVVQTTPNETKTSSNCGATPPADLADPEGDPLGWEGGYWYSESLAVAQADGLNESELNATIARTMARVEVVRCLEFEEPVPVEIISRDQFREREHNRSVSPALRTFDNAKFEALFLINESANSLTAQSQNRGSNVLGFYDPKNDSIVVISENASSLQMDEITLAHELVHALQDRRYNLSADPFAVRTRDDANAVNGLVEGDAQNTATLYERRCQQGAWNGTCLGQSSSPSGSLANIGVYFLKFQPYSDGPTFVQRIYANGGWEAVNELYENPPTSTEQVIHPERYGNDSEANVSIDDRSTDAWTPVAPPGRQAYASVGEAGLASMFVYPTYHSQGTTQIVTPEEWLNTTESGRVSSIDPINYETRFSEGWDGDQLRVYRNEENETAYLWRLAWDSPQDAREFVEGYRRVLSYWGAEQVGSNTYRIDEGGFADAFHISVDGSNVTIVNAPTVEGLSEVRQGIDVQAEDPTNETKANTTAGGNR